MGRLRREALESLARQARERALHGQEFRTWAYRVRAQLGSDFALDLALYLADREPPS